MKIIYFDTIAGISGDMILGAFISSGISINELNYELQKLNLKNVEIFPEQIERHGISAIKVEVNFPKQHHHRNFKSIVDIINSSSLSSFVKQKSIEVFHNLAIAESKIHNIEIEKIHFHEVGAIDSIIDIVGSVICIEKLKIEKCFSSVVKVGNGGFVDAEHGKLPIPTPAVLEILKDYPIDLSPIPFELTTPTGAAILKTFSSGILEIEKIKTQQIGYGSGSRDLKSIPNLLRIIIGEIENDFEDDEVIVIETNIDDMNPEIISFVTEKIILLGAKDVFTIPINMKKGRSGILLQIIADKNDLEKISEIIFSETTAIGFRYYFSKRKKLKREIIKIQTEFGILTAKLIEYKGEKKIVPEYEECKKIAIEKNIPLQKVYEIIRQTKI